MPADVAAQQLREKLEGMLAERIKREEALEKHLRGTDGRLEQDFADRVAYTEMDEVTEQLDDQAREEIEMIRAALGRIEQGTWQTCTVCGADINPARLLAIPFTTRCVDCAA